MDSNHRRRKQQIYSLPHLATLVFAPTLQKELFSLLNHRRVNFTRTISVLISSPPREERLIPLILERASCRIRTNDPEITNHVLWPTELKRQAKKCNRNVHSVSETAANLGIYFYPQNFSGKLFAPLLFLVLNQLFFQSFQA